jgi:RNA polymerase subunit RPABC4/transcription elongation factor Spt4
MCGPGHHMAHRGDHQGGVEDVAVKHPQSPQASKRCAHCGAQVREDFVFCPRCGAELLAACPECHRAVETDWTHCAYCGAELVEA